MAFCKQCRKQLPLSRRRAGFCAPNKKTGQNCQADYAREHGQLEPLPRLFDTPEPPRPQRIVSPHQIAPVRRHGRDRRNE